MPIVKNANGTDRIAIALGYGDVHSCQALNIDAATGVPNLDKSFVGFMEMEIPAGMSGGEQYRIQPGELPPPSITIHFAGLENLDEYINNLMTFKQLYLQRLSQVSKKAAQA